MLQGSGQTAPFTPKFSQILPIEVGLFTREIRKKFDLTKIKKKSLL